MAKRKHVSTWLKNDQEQLDWAKDYFFKLRVDFLADELSRGHHYVVEALERYAATATGLLFINTMRNTWAKGRSNRRRGKGSKSYSLTDTATTRLAELARLKGKPKNAIIESLIEKGFGFEEEERKFRRDALVQERKAWKERKPYKLAPTFAEMTANQRIAALEREVAARRTRHESLLFQFTQYEVILETTKKTVTTEQERKAGELYSSLLAHYEASVKAASDIPGAVVVTVEANPTSTIEGVSGTGGCLADPSLATVDEGTSNPQAACAEIDGAFDTARTAPTEEPSSTPPLLADARPRDTSEEEQKLNPEFGIDQATLDSWNSFVGPRQPNNPKMRISAHRDRSFR